MEFDRAAEFFRRHDSFIITSHESPDADGLGAEYALVRALRMLGKKARSVNAHAASPKYGFIDPEGLIEVLSSAALSDHELAESTMVLVDTNDIQFTGEMATLALNRAARLCIFDHHEFRGLETEHAFMAPNMSSTCEMAYWTLRALGVEPDASMANALMAGIVYDTGSFAYSKTGASTFRAALDLVEKGANPYSVHSALYESSETSGLLLRKEVLGSLVLELGGRLALQYMDKSVLERTGAEYEDAEDLINAPLQAKSVEVSVFFKENREGTLRCSLRSKGTVNVAQIAQSMGGGGHKRAAGFKCPYPLDETRFRVVELIRKSLPD